MSRHTTDTPALYRIDEAARRLGTPATTLRAWERRYGITKPTRSASGYRLYDDDDLHWLARMRELVDSGLVASEAARLVGNEQAPERTAAGPGEAERFAASILTATAHFDDGLLERTLRDVTRLLRPLDALRDVFEPALREVGQLWVDGRIDISHEHWLTYRLRAQLASMLIAARPRIVRGVAVIAAFPEENHDVACYVLAVCLALAGYQTVVLGARTPATALAVAVRETAADLVCLSLTCPPTPRDKAAMRDYADACKGRTLWVGGQGAATLPLHGARFIGTSWPEVAQALAELSPPRRKRRNEPANRT